MWEALFRLSLLCFFTCMPQRQFKSKVILSTGCRALLAILRHRGSRRGRTTDDLRNDNHCARARCTSASDSENCVPARGRTAGWRGGGGTTSAQPRLRKLLFLSGTSVLWWLSSKLHQPIVRYFWAVNCEQLIPSKACIHLFEITLQRFLWCQSSDLRTDSVFVAADKKGHFWRVVCVSCSSEFNDAGESWLKKPNS